MSSRLLKSKEVRMKRLYRISLKKKIFFMGEWIKNIHCHHGWTWKHLGNTTLWGSVKVHARVWLRKGDLWWMWERSSYWVGSQTEEPGKREHGLCINIYFYPFPNYKWNMIESCTVSLTMTSPPWCAVPSTCKLKQTCPSLSCLYHVFSHNEE